MFQTVYKKKKVKSIPSISRIQWVAILVSCYCHFSQLSFFFAPDCHKFPPNKDSKNSCHSSVYSTLWQNEKWCSIHKMYWTQLMKTKGVEILHICLYLSVLRMVMCVCSHIWLKMRKIVHTNNENFALECIFQKSKGANVVCFWRK